MFYLWASLVAEMVENLPTMKETWVQSLDEENPLDKGTDTHCSILAWRIHGQRSLVSYTVHGVTKNQTQLRE